MTITHLVTHSGGFHADELLSSVVLTRLFPKAKLLRSRDRQWVTPAADKTIYDVGGAYDSEAQIFDHYQRPGPLRESNQPFSSFGLIWAHCGRAYPAHRALNRRWSDFLRVDALNSTKSDGLINILN